MRYLGLMAVVLSLSACSTVTDMSATGGSRADGVVEMSYEYALGQPVKIDRLKAQESASRRCQSWGYKSAESFDDGLRTCIDNGMLGCNGYRVTVRYQCIKPE
ncbi:YecR family lipoprotein [Klebsiella michiganensis]|uniref:YecR family lipoprotein n=1 Tax=Klebsiella michiganensis TaxID=1134687 RepID=UPI0030CAAA4D